MILSLKQPKRGFRLLAASLCLAAGASATPTTPVSRVLDGYIDATGGDAAWHNKKSERDEIEGRAIESGRLVLHAMVALTRSGNSIHEIKVPAEAREGVYKGTAWAWTKLSGPRIKRGPDRDEALRSSHMLEDADWRTLYPDSRYGGIEEIDGRPCYKVNFLPSDVGKTEWFDVRTGLLTRRAALEFTSEGIVRSVYDVESWGTQDGLTQPVSMLVKRGDFRYRLSVLSVAYNDVRQPDFFRYPPQVEGYLALERAGKALPNAEELIERHIFESGGASAYERLKSQRITGTLEFLSRNLTAHTEALSAADGRYYQLVDIPGLGKEEQGSDGRIVWERSPALGPRARPRKGGMSSSGLTVDASQVVGWRFLVGEVRTEALESIDGHECYRVSVTARDGTLAATRWYDRQTGLLYRSGTTLKTDMGNVPAVMTYQAYRNVSGLKWPVRIHMAISGQELLFKADRVELNSPVDDSAFEVPGEIRELAKNH